MVLVMCVCVCVFHCCTNTSKYSMTLVLTCLSLQPSPLREQSVVFAHLRLAKRNSLHKRGDTKDQSYNRTLAAKHKLILHKETRGANTPRRFTGPHLQAIRFLARCASWSHDWGNVELVPQTSLMHDAASTSLWSLKYYYRLVFCLSWRQSSEYIVMQSYHKGNRKEVMNMTLCKERIHKTW